VRRRLVAPRAYEFLRSLPRREEPSRQRQPAAVYSAGPTRSFPSRGGSLSGAIGRTAQVLSPRGGIRLGQIQTLGFYWAGFLGVILAALKLPTGGPGRGGVF